MIDQRLHERNPVAFQVRVTSVAEPGISATGEAADITRSGIGVFLPLHFTPGSLVQLDIADSVLCGFIRHSRQWLPPANPSTARNKLWIDESDPSGMREGAADRPFYYIGIELAEISIGTSGLSQLLKVTLDGNLRGVHMA